MFNCHNQFDCFYVNRPYCSLRPMSSITPCPHFSCPPPCNVFPPFDGCCPQNFCSPQFNCPQQFCRPPQFNCWTGPRREPNLNLIWFLGGYRCGKNQGSNIVPRNFEQFHFLRLTKFQLCVVFLKDWHKVFLCILQLLLHKKQFLHMAKLFLILI